MYFDPINCEAYEKSIPHIAATINFIKLFTWLLLCVRRNWYWRRKLRWTETHL